MKAVRMTAGGEPALDRVVDAVVAPDGQGRIVSVNPALAGRRGGRIETANEAGRGSVFTLVLPHDGPPLETGSG